MTAKAFFLFILPFILFFTSCAGTTNDESLSYISSIDVEIPGVQRDKIPFVIRNKSAGSAKWVWEVIDSESGKVIEASSQAEPGLSLPVGTYDIRVIATGTNILQRHIRRAISVLPPVFEEKDADEIFDLNAVDGELLAKDYDNIERPGYKIVIKGRLNGRIRITGLRGTKENPVHIINQGQVEVNPTSMNSPYPWQFSDNNQYIILDGLADPSVQYGFRLKGHPSKSGQILFIAGEFNRGFEICGVNLIGQQGKTYGAAALQIQTSFTKKCNASNWNFEYFHFHHNKIERASSEGLYVGYFTDEKRETGYSPYRVGNVIIYRDTIIDAGWDGIQIASADEFEVHDNYVNGTSLSGKRSHSSFLSWNSGNTIGWCYRNTFVNGAHGASVVFGESGKEAYIYSNLFIEGNFPSNITTPAFLFAKVSNARQNVGIYIFHNTISTSRISAKVDYKNDKGGNGIPVLFAGNAILQNRLNLKKFPEIAMGSNLSDSTAWTIDNVWRMKDQEGELLWDKNYHPLPGSPLLNISFDIREHIPKLKGGYYDRDGYPFRNDELGVAAGCFGAWQLSTSPKP